MHPQIKKTFKKHHLIGSDLGGKSSREVPILLRKKKRFLGQGAELISYRTRKDNRGIAPDRYLTWVRYKHGGRNYCLINLHPNAAVQNRATGNVLNTSMARVKQYLKSMRALEREIKQQRADGYIVVVTGDLNFRVKTQDGKPWKWSPEAVFARTGLDYYAVGLDYIAWDKKNLRRKRVRTIPVSRTGSDHPWIVANLVPKKS